MDQMLKPAYPSLNKNVTGLVVGINNTQDSYQTSFMESRIHHLIQSQRMAINYEQGVSSGQKTEFQNNFLSPTLFNPTLYTPLKPVEFQYEPLSPQQPQQFQIPQDQFYQNQLKAEYIIGTFQQQQNLNQYNNIEDLFNYYENLLISQQFLSKQSQMVQYILFQQQNAMDSDDNSSNPPEGQELLQFNGQQQKYQHNERKQIYKQNYLNQPKRYSRENQNYQQSQKKQIKMTNEKVNHISNKGKVCFKVSIALKDIYKQQVRWICLESLGIKSDHLQEYTVMDLKQSILKYYKYQLTEFDKTSICYKRFGEQMLCLQDNLILNNISFTNQTTIKIVQNMISKNKRSFHPQIKNAKTFFTNPSLSQLIQLSENNLKALKDFKVKTLFGEISFLEPVDITGLILDEIIILTQNHLDFYPQGTMIMPIFGKGLNVPSIVKFYNFGRLQGGLQQDYNEQFYVKVQDWAIHHRMEILEFKDGNLSVKLEHA